MVTAVAPPSEERATQFGVTAARVFCKSNGAQLTEINRLIETGAVTTHVETVLPRAEVRRAHRLSETGRTRGKIVLRIAA